MITWDWHFGLLLAGQLSQADDETTSLQNIPFQVAMCSALLLREYILAVASEQIQLSLNIMNMDIMKCQI